MSGKPSLINPTQKRMRTNKRANRAAVSALKQTYRELASDNERDSSDSENEALRLSMGRKAAQHVAAAIHAIKSRTKAEILKMTLPAGVLDSTGQSSYLPAAVIARIAHYATPMHGVVQAKDNSKRLRDAAEGTGPRRKKGKGRR